MQNIQITDCPRDAIQGLHHLISTESKARYIQAALDSGLFHSVDFGSFVSHKAVPQMADTAEVLKLLKKTDFGTKLLAIIANERGAHEAAECELVDILGFPFSASEVFQNRNTGAGREEALGRIKSILKIGEDKGKSVRIYISMAFGNPYQELWNSELVEVWVKRLFELGVQEIALSDTVGIALEQDISNLFFSLTNRMSEITFSGHFHARPGEWRSKVKAAYEAGCTHFDGAMQGFGGCPMADDELVGNIPTEGLLALRGVSPDKIDNLTKAFQKLIANG